MRVTQASIDSNVRMSKFKVAVLELVYSPEHREVTGTEAELVLQEILHDRAQVRLRHERGSDVES